MVNYLAILVAGIASMVLGFLWYGPLFGKAWMQMMGFTMKDMKKKQKEGMTRTYLIAFVGTLVMAYVLSVFVENMGIEGGLTTAFWLWLGFIATVSLGNVLWGGKPFKLWILNNAYNLVNLAVLVLILTTWV